MSFGMQEESLQIGERSGLVALTAITHPPIQSGLQPKEITFLG